MKKWIRNSLPYLAFLILAIAYFSPVIIPTLLRNSGNMVIFGIDLLQVNGLDRIHFINSLKKGIIPWWNPYIHNGLTFHALANGQFFYQTPQISKFTRKMWPVCQRKSRKRVH